MKFKGTWFLALLAIALGLYVYLIEFKKAAKDEERKNAEEKIIDFDSAKVKSIVLKNSKGEFVIEKDGATDWKLTQPLADKGDKTVINNVLSALALEKYDDVIDVQSDADLKNFGLDKPVESISITTQDGVTKKMAVGVDAAIAGKIYLQRGDEKKALYANSGVKIQLDKGLKELRDKSVFRKNKDDIIHFTVKSNGKDNHSNVSLTKKDGKWTLDSNGEEADGAVTDSFLKAVTSLNATDFPSEKSSDKAEQKKYGLNSPELDITLERKDTAGTATAGTATAGTATAGTANTVIQHFVFSPKKDNNIFVSVEGTPTVYQLYASAIEPLIKKPQDFRNKRIPLEFKKEDVADIYIKSSTGELHLVKKGTSWDFYLADDTKTVSQIQITNFLDKVADLKVADYVENEKAIGLNPPLGHIILKDPKNEILLDFSWGDRAKVQRNDYAKTSKYKGLFTVDATSIASIPIQTLVDKKAAPTPAGVGKLPTPSGIPAK